jgi:hypothetical protein
MSVLRQCLAQVRICCGEWSLADAVSLDLPSGSANRAHRNESEFSVDVMTGVPVVESYLFPPPDAHFRPPPLRALRPDDTTEN